MKKVAIALHGLSSGVSDKGMPVNFSDAVRTLKENLIHPNSHDHSFEIYFHTWDNEKIGDIVREYQPKKYNVEKQIDFSDVLGEEDITRLSKHINESYKHYNFITPKKVMSMIYSRFYSLWKSLSLLEGHFDLVISIRFDVLLLTRFDLNEIDAKTMTCSNFIENQDCLDTELVTIDGYSTSYSPDIYDYGVMDYIFISNQNAMMRFGQMVMYIAKYLEEGSGYYDNKWPCLLSGHPLSAYHLRASGIPISYYMTDNVDMCLDRDKFDRHINDLIKSKNDGVELMAKVGDLNGRYNVNDMPFNLISQIGTSYWRCDMLREAEYYWNISYGKQKNNTDCVNLMFLYSKMGDSEKLKRFYEEGIHHNYISKDDLQI